MELKYKYNIFASFFKYYNIYIYTIYFKYSLNCHTFKSFIRDKLKYINNLSLLHDILIWKKFWLVIKEFW